MPKRSVIDPTPVGLHLNCLTVIGRSVNERGTSSLKPHLTDADVYRKCPGEEPGPVFSKEERERQAAEISQLEVELARLRSEQRRLETVRLRDRVIALRTESMACLRNAQYPIKVTAPVRDRPWRVIPEPTPEDVEATKHHTVEDVLSKAESYLLSHRASHPPAAGPFSPVLAPPPPPLAPEAGVAWVGREWGRAASAFVASSPGYGPWTPHRGAAGAAGLLRSPGGAATSPLLPSETMPEPVASPRRAALEQVRWS